MDIQEHTSSHKLDYYSFYWTEARLVIAAIALFLGGTPPILFLFGSNYSLYSLINPLLNIAWVLSGVVAVYLLYRWFQEEKKVFGGNDILDTSAFFVSIVSGLNLGITGIAQINIGMNISQNMYLFWIVGILYLLSAWHLFKRWKENNKQLFSTQTQDSDGEVVQ